MSKGGKNSKRKPLDVQWRDKLTKALGDSDRSALDAIYGILLNEAKNGNIQAIRELLDRSFGKAIQFTVNSEVKENNPVLENMVKIRQELELKRKGQIIEYKED